MNKLMVELKTVVTLEFLLCFKLKISLSTYIY